MKKTITFFSKIFFGLELAFVLVIPFVIWWSTTPTNGLISHFLYKLLEIVGIVGCGLLPAGIPVGIIGIIMSKRMEQLRKSTLILSIINLSVGSIEILMLLALFCAVVFGGASV
ncbi:MAG: hypothetical protein IJX62_01820 [Clostridia bacterium]|nr:hypothetical protein [Clostridia bacterium]